MTQEQYRFPEFFSDSEMAAYQVCCWIRDHYSDFKSLISLVNRQVNLGNPCVKQGELEMYVRDSNIRLDIGEEFRHNRNLYPGLTRYMVMLRPRLARSIRFRRSKLDELDLAAIWHEVVDPNTVFLASSRMEAEHLVAIGDASAA